MKSFPPQLEEPDSYQRGVNLPAKRHCRNALVFMREDRVSLQQMHFSNRSHNRHVLILVLQTPGSVTVDGIETPLGPGQGLLVLPYQFHHYLNIENERLRWLFITFELDEGAAPLDPFAHRLLQPEQDTLQTWAAIAQTWASAGSSLHEVLPQIDLLLLKLEKANPEVSVNPLPRQDNSWIARVESLLRQAVDEHWTLDEVARRCGISERHLRTRFEAETGVSIRRYRANYQLHRTLSLMQGRQVSLSDIAGRVGFQSSAAFSRFIRRETGLTPSELKRTL